MKLNGWQRLWILFSFLWVVSVAGYTFANKKSESEIYHLWANDLIGYLVTQASDLKGYSTSSLRSIYSDISDKELVEVLHKKYIGKHPAYSYGFAEIDVKYEGKIKGETDLLLHVIVALGLPILIYLVGWSVGWVRNGFKNA